MERMNNARGLPTLRTLCLRMRTILSRIQTSSELLRENLSQRVPL